MKAALITEEQIKAIEDALEMVLVSSECEAYFDALAIVKSLKVKEPVAWYAQDNLEINDEVEVVWNRQMPMYAEVWKPLYSGEKP